MDGFAGSDRLGRRTSVGAAVKLHRPPFRHILHLDDGSEHALDALHHAVEMAILLNARLEVAIIVGTPTNWQADDDILGHSAEDRLSIRRALVERIAARASLPVARTVLVGKPSQVGLNFARESGCDLIVIGATTAHNVHDRLWGSRSSRIARDGACSVLVVRSAPTDTS
jgi:nucleotide-binding universal stress UspA family protein